MSWKATAYVKDLVRTPSGETLTVTEKLILFILADDHRNDDGETWPSMQLLAERAMISERYVTIALKSLERKKVLAVIRGQGRRHKSAYRFLELDACEQELPLEAESDDKTRTEFTFSQNTLDLDVQSSASQQVADDEMGKGEKPELSSPFIAADDTAGKGEKGENKTRKTRTLQQRNKESTGYTGFKTSATDVAAVGDNRHGPVREAIKRLQRCLLEMESWDGADAKALAQLLTTTTAGPNHLIKCAVFRAMSPDTAFSELPRRWLKNLTEYADGPLDRYRKRAAWRQATFDRLYAAAIGRVEAPAPKPAIVELPQADPIVAALWARVLERVEPQINRLTFDTFLKPSHGMFTQNDGRKLFVRVPTEEFKAISTKFHVELFEAIAAEGLPIEELEFVPAVSA